MWAAHSHLRIFLNLVIRDQRGAEVDDDVHKEEDHLDGVHTPSNSVGIQRLAYRDEHRRDVCPRMASKLRTTKVSAIA